MYQNMEALENSLGKVLNQFDIIAKKNMKVMNKSAEIL